MFWCPAPLPGGKAELAGKPPRAVKDEGKQSFRWVPLEHLGSPGCCPVAKAARPSQLVALTATNPVLGSTACATRHQHPQAEGLSFPSPALCHATEKHIPDMVLDSPLSPSNVLTRILWASEGIGFPAGSGRRVLDVNFLSSLLHFTLSGNSSRAGHACPRLPGVSPAEGGCGGWERLAPQAG